MNLRPTFLQKYNTSNKSITQYEINFHVESNNIKLIFLDLHDFASIEDQSYRCLINKNSKMDVDV